MADPDARHGFLAAMHRKAYHPPWRGPRCCQNCGAVIDYPSRHWHAVELPAVGDKLPRKIIVCLRCWREKYREKPQALPPPGLARDIVDGLREVIRAMVKAEVSRRFTTYEGPEHQASGFVGGEGDTDAEG